MVAISSGGKNWGPWTIYRIGAYRRHLKAARDARAWLATADGKAALKELKEKYGKGQPPPKGKPDPKPKPGTRPAPKGNGGKPLPGGTGGGGTGGSGSGTPVTVRVTTGQLRAARDKLRGWAKSDVPSGRSAAANVAKTHAASARHKNMDYTAHNTIHAALVTAGTVWDEAFRLTLQEVTLLGDILNECAGKLDLKDAELAALVWQQKDIR